MKTMKKVGAVVLALCLCLSLCVTAFAASSSDDTTFSITVTGAADGETYTAYKIFDVTYDDEDHYSYTIDSSSAWYSTVAAATDVFTLTQVTGTNTYVVTVNEDVEDDAIIAVFTEAGVPEDATAAATTTAENGQAVLNVTDSGAGYYYVTTSLGSLVIIDTTNPTQEIAEKNGIPTVEKWVHENSAADDTWQHEDDASNAESILFEINISNINGAVNLVLHDSMDSELHLADETNFHLNSIVLYTSEDDENPAELTEATWNDATESWINGDFYLTVGECTVEGCTLENCAFEVHFLRDFDDVDATGYITLTYYLVLDTERDTYEGDFDEIDNYAQVTFATYSASAPVQAETYSFGFEIFKYTGDLGDVEAEYGTYYVFEDTITHDGPSEIDNDFYFVATDGSYEYYAVMTQLSDSSYIVTDWVNDEDNATSITEPQDETTYTIYVTESSMSALAALESESSVASLLSDARFHLAEVGGSESELQDEDAIEYEVEYGTVPGTVSPLAGAVFEVSNEEGKTAYFYEEDVTLEDGTTKHIYLFEGWLDEDEPLPENSNYTTSVTSASDGMIYIEGLDTGTYIVTEIAAPDGYNLLTTPIYVTIWAQYDNETGECLDHGVTWTLGEDGEEESGVVNVENNSGTLLPGTGGMGTTIFYIVGAILICGAVVVLVTRRRVNRAA